LLLLRFENYAKRLPDKRNIDHLKLFSKHVIPKMEDKIINVEVPLMARYIIVLPHAPHVPTKNRSTPAAT
jgi:hypothetical protein